MVSIFTPSTSNLPTYVGLLDKTLSKSRSFMWQRRYNTSLLRVSLRTKDRDVAIQRWKQLSIAFVKLSTLGIDAKSLQKSLVSARNSHINQSFLQSLNVEVMHLPILEENSSHRAIQSVSDPIPEHISPLLSEVLKEWLDEMDSEWKPRTRKANENIAQKFIDWKGDVPISSVTKKDVADYKVYVEGLFNAPRTRQDALVKASGMFTFAVNKRDYVDKNVFSGMFYRAVENSSEKVSITKSEHDEAVLNAKGRDVEQLKWMMRILWHTGLRIGEVIQLRECDYRLIDGVWCFSINTEDGKTLKTKDSVRDIPIASTLIEQGILDVKPTFPWKSSSSAGERIRLTFKAIGHERTAHCYRYSISDRLRDLPDVPDHVRYSILGHSHNVITDRVYRGKQPIELMKDAIDKV